MTAKRNSLRLYDTKDDRREVATLIRRLPPKQTLRFLEWCCANSKIQHGSQRPVVSRQTRALADKARWDTGAVERLWRESLFDFWYLVTQFEFDVEAGLKRLVAMVKRGN
jgi:hypothetical protein